MGMKFYILLIIAVAAGSVIESSNILIQDNSSKPCVHQKIVGTQMVVFPEKLQIQIHLIKLPGLLFYGFYKTCKIIGILEEKEIKLTFQGQQYNTSLQDLCKCDPCLYQSLTFTFEINDNITVECSGNKVVKKKLPTKIQRNLVHSFTDSYENESAHLYLVYIPSYINDSYHYKTLTGCIQEVKYKDIVLKFDRYGSGTSNECTRHCNVTTCNGGQCLETFDDHPLCDCQFAFLNGDHCDSVLGHGFNAVVNLHFQILKLSWNSSVEKILVVSNISNSIEILHKNQKLSVLFKGLEWDNTITIDKKYSSTDQYILTISIDKQIVNIAYKSKTMSSWRNLTTLLPDNSLNCKYSSITFLNNKHTEKGDLVYKTYRSDYMWLGFRDNVTIGQQLEENIIQQKKLDGKDITIIVLSVILLLFITIVGIIILFVKYMKLLPLKSRQMKRNKASPNYYHI